MTIPNIHASASQLWKKTSPPVAVPQPITPGPPDVAPRSALVAALKARPRHARQYPVESFAAGMPGHIRVRIANLAEQELAIIQAHAHIAKAAEVAAPVANDSDFTSNAKTAFILHQAIRDDADPDGLPAFPSPGWMLEHFTAQELSVLLNAYNTEVAKTQPVEVDLDSDKLATLALTCAKHAGTEVPDVALARFSRETMAEAFIRLSVMFADVLEENAALLAESSPPTRPEPSQGAADPQESLLDE